MLVTFQQDVDIGHEGFQPQHHPRHPRAASLEEPNQLVDVVTGNLLRLLQEEDSLGVPCQQSSEGSPVLTGTHRELGVAVRPE